MKKEQLETLYSFTKQQIAFRWQQIDTYQKKAKAIIDKMGFSNSLDLFAEGQIEKLNAQAAALEGNKEYKAAAGAISEHGYALYSMIILQAFLNSDKARKGYRAYKLETLADKAVEMYIEYSTTATIEADKAQEIQEHMEDASYRYIPIKPKAAEDISEVEKFIASMGKQWGVTGYSEAAAEHYRAAIRSAIQFVFHLTSAGETAAAGEVEQQPTREVVVNNFLEQVLFTTAKTHRLLPQLQAAQELEGVTSHPVRVSPANAKREVCIDVAIYTDANVTGIDHLTEFDKLVLNAVYTLYAAGQNTFSVEQVYKVMTGTKNQTRITDRSLLDKIDKSLQKCILTYISINCKQQREQQNYRGLQADEYKDHLLPMAQLTNATFHSSNGKQVIGNCYKLHAAPPVYAYSKALNQLQRFNADVLQVPVSNTENAMLLRGVLLTRIALAYSKDYIANVSYNALYSEAGIVLSTSDRKQKTRLRDTIIKMFDYWKSIKLVRSYKEYSTNGKVTGLEFSVYPKDKHKEIE